MLIYGTAFSDNAINLIRENGLGLELLQYSDPAFLDNFDSKHAQITQYMQGISGVSVHGAYLDTFYTSKDPLIREVSKKRFLQSVQAAAFHSIDRVVFHTAYRRYFDGHSKPALDNFLKKSIEFWQNFEENIPDGMTVYLENVEEENPEILIKIIEGINSPKIQACFDVGHAFCSSSVDLITWINVLGGTIGHVHIHDNDGSFDQHLPLGKGKIPILNTIQEILKHVGDKIPFVLECDVPESLECLRKEGIKI